ncbi:MAG: type II secretion system F family protein [Phycisphaerae bacterium]
MGTYQYIAKNSGGQQVRGLLSADSEAAVLSALSERNLYPVEVSEYAERGLRLRKRVSPRRLAVAYGQLADLLGAGVSLLPSLEIVHRACRDQRLAEALLHVRDCVAEGNTLAEAMRSRPQAFQPLHCAMIRSGEEAGFLEDVLRNLSEFLERQDELRGKVLGAMIYPAVVMFAGTAGLLLILLFLVPRFEPLFENMSQPLPTQILFGLSRLLRGHLGLLLGVVILAAAGVKALLSSESGRRTWERWRVKLPFAGRVIRMISVTRFCRILGTMLANGVPIIRALEISKTATGSVLLTDRVAEAAENVRRGDPLAEPLRKSGMFPPEVVEMVAVAEESNQLERVLVHIADTVERRMDRQVDQAVRLIEPLILVLLAGALAFVAAGLLIPIIKLGEAFR